MALFEREEFWSDHHRVDVGEDNHGHCFQGGLHLRSTQHTYVSLLDIRAGENRNWDAREGDDEDTPVGVGHDEDGIHEEVGLRSEVHLDIHREDNAHILGEVDGGILDYYCCCYCHPEGHLPGRHCLLLTVESGLPRGTVLRELAWSSYVSAVVVVKNGAKRNQSNLYC